jgi:hypothetical protein
MLKDIGIHELEHDDLIPVCDHCLEGPASSDVLIQIREISEAFLMLSVGRRSQSVSHEEYHLEQAEQVAHNEEDQDTDIPPALIWQGLRGKDKLENYLNELEGQLFDQDDHQESRFLIIKVGEEKPTHVEQVQINQVLVNLFWPDGLESHFHPIYEHVDAHRDLHQPVY